MSEEFYIGYQKQMPPGLAEFLRRRIAVGVALALIIGVTVVLAQHPFSKGSFEFGKLREFEGVVSTRPYPTLILCKPESGCSRYLLVKPGKHGAEDLFVDGQYVKLRGSLVERDHRSMIEVDPSSVAAIGDREPGSATPATDLGTFTLRGEIVDSKCFLGVMKPGELKPHKSCAIRCISGGCPPVLVVRDDEGTATYFLLAAADGGPLDRRVLDYVAEPLELTGDVEKRDDLFVLKTDVQSWTRL